MCLGARLQVLADALAAGIDNFTSNDRANVKRAKKDLMISDALAKECLATQVRHVLQPVPILDSQVDTCLCWRSPSSKALTATHRSLLVPALLSITALAGTDASNCCLPYLRNLWSGKALP